MKVICLVLASIEEPYKTYREIGLRTWDSIEHPDVQTFYYFSHILDYTMVNGKNLYFHAGMGYYDMHWRLKLALDYIDREHEYDYIFKMSATSYIDKERLIEKAHTLPKEKVYCGIECGGVRAASGCGNFMSKDVVKILREQIPQDISSVEWSHPDDVLVAKVLQLNGIELTEGAERFDFYHHPLPPPKTYHYRCKWEEDTIVPVQAAMEYLFYNQSDEQFRQVNFNNSDITVR